MQKLTIVVPEKLIGGVIGKKGAQIKVIRGDNPNMQVHVAQEDTRIETNNGEETVCLVTLFVSFKLFVNTPNGKEAFGK